MRIPFDKAKSLISRIWFDKIKSCDGMQRVSDSIAFHEDSSLLMATRIIHLKVFDVSSSLSQSGVTKGGHVYGVKSVETSRKSHIPTTQSRNNI